MRLERRGGARPGAGRPRGSKNRKPVLPPGGRDPLEILQAIAEDESAAPSARVNACKALLDARKGAPAGEAPAIPTNADGDGIVWLKRSNANA